MRWLAAAVLVVLVVGPASAGDPVASRRHGQVVRVLDGDTIVVDLGGRRTHVRLIGVDAPEAHESPKLDRQVAAGFDRAAILALGAEATAYTRMRLEGRSVALELDVETHDRYGRLLAWVWLPDGTLFNADLVASGYARLLTIPPNVRHLEVLRPLERQARAAGRGLWAAPPSARPGTERRPRRQAAPPAAAPDRSGAYPAPRPSRASALRTARAASRTSCSARRSASRPPRVGPVRRASSATWQKVA